eukprot:6204058-Prymnesium_polylepis.1
MQRPAIMLKWGVCAYRQCDRWSWCFYVVVRRSINSRRHSAGPWSLTDPHYMYTLPSSTAPSRELCVCVPRAKPSSGHEKGHPLAARGRGGVIRGPVDLLPVTSCGYVPNPWGSNWRWGVQPDDSLAKPRTALATTAPMSQITEDEVDLAAARIQAVLRGKLFRTSTADVKELIKSAAAKTHLGRLGGMQPRPVDAREAAANRIGSRARRKIAQQQTLKREAEEEDAARRIQVRASIAQRTRKKRAARAARAAETGAVK